MQGVRRGEHQPAQAGKEQVPRVPRTLENMPMPQDLGES